MAKKKSWREKLAIVKQSKKVRLENAFAGIPAGSLMFVGTPQMVAEYIKNIPFGETRTPLVLRDEMAKMNQCNAMCPVSTGIFIRIAAEAAIEEMQEGIPCDGVIPFWRVVEPQSNTAKKLAIDAVWIQTQREAESD